MNVEIVAGLKAYAANQDSAAREKLLSSFAAHGAKLLPSLASMRAELSEDDRSVLDEVTFAVFAHESFNGGNWDPAYDILLKESFNNGRCGEVQAVLGVLPRDRAVPLIEAMLDWAPWEASYVAVHPEPELVAKVLSYFETRSPASAGTQLSIEVMKKLGPDALPTLERIVAAAKKKDKAVGKIMQERVAALKSTGSKQSRVKASVAKPAKEVALADVLKKLKKSLVEAEMSATWRDGVDAKTLTQIEKTIGAALPEEVREFYLTVNGIRCDDLTEEGGIVSLEEAVETWREMCKSLKSEKSDHDESRVQELWWSDKWLPISEGGAGDYFCVDLNPRKGGTLGQVIHFDHAGPERRWVAPSMKAWLKDIQERL